MRWTTWMSKWHNSAFMGRTRDICFPPGLSWGLLKWLEQALLPGHNPIPLQMHRAGHLTTAARLEHPPCQPFPLCWLARLSLQQRLADCHFSPLSQKDWKIQMVLLRKAWLIFHLLFYSGETKWNKIIYKRWLYPILLTRYNESVNSWSNSSDFELMSKGWVGLKKQNAIQPTE